MIDAKQGVSGAGRAFDDTTHLSMAGENILPYKVAAHRHTPEIEEQLAPLRAGAGQDDELAVLFQAHLVPLDQGELADCYVTTTRSVDDAELGELFAAAYTHEPFVEVVADSAGHARRARDELLPRVRQGRSAQRQGRRAVGDRQPVEGHVLAGDPEPQRDVLPARDGRADMSDASPPPPGTTAAPPPQPFFHSRWVPAPPHVTDVGPAGGLPGGFRAAGVVCGIKPSGNPDVGVLVCDAEKPVSAARFTASGTPAAPVLVSQERCRLDALRAVLANSGCANAATGGRGLDDAAKTQGAAAMALGVDPAEVALASTGAISHHLPVESMLKGILAASTQLQRGGDGAFQQAIQTTDLTEKRATLDVALPSGTVRLTAQCKGAGMISPNFATMLCFVQTDAELSPETAELLLGVCVQALVRSRVSRRAAVDERHGDPDVLGRERRAGRTGRARTSCALARPWTRCCASWRS